MITLCAHPMTRHHNGTVTCYACRATLQDMTCDTCGRHSYFATCRECIGRPLESADMPTWSDSANAPAVTVSLVKLAGAHRVEDGFINPATLAFRWSVRELVAIRTGRTLVPHGGPAMHAARP